MWGVNFLDRFVACNCNLPNNDLYSNFVRPASVRVRLFPSSVQVNLKDIFTGVVYLDTAERNRATKDQAHEVVFQRPAREIRNV